MQALNRLLITWSINTINFHSQISITIYDDGYTISTIKVIKSNAVGGDGIPLYFLNLAPVIRVAIAPLSFRFGMLLNISYQN